MFHWIPIAFVRLVFFFALGILLAIYQPQLASAHEAALGFGILVILYAAIVAQKRWTINTGPIGLLALAVAGYLNVQIHTEAHEPRHILQVQQPITYYEAVIASGAEEKANSWKHTAIVRTVGFADGTWQAAGGRVVQYFSKKDFPQPFVYGNVLVIKGSPAEVQPPANPGEFDYKRFLTFRNIHHQHFIRAGDALQKGFEPPNTLMHHAIRVRTWAEDVLKRHVTGKQEQAIALALVLGITDELDNDLLQAYAATGSMHVLAVSGLHVGIIYGILLVLLSPLNRWVWGKWVLALISLLTLWGYAFVTGLSPSVLRAVVMFSFVAMARPLSYKTNVFNVLAASAFCLLLYNPYLIMSVGFQLSYLAVLGIVYLQPLLYRQWEPSGYLLDKMWQITCVSLAAQLATFSLGLLYFHQFPVYFLFSNLIVIPGSFAVLVLGLGVLAVSFINVLAQGVGALLTWIIQALNASVFLVEGWPFSLIDAVYITTFQSWLLMGIVFGMIVLLNYRKFYGLVLATSCAVLFGIAQFQQYTKRVEPVWLTVYRVAHQTAFEISERGKAHVFADSSLLTNADKVRFHLRPNRLRNGTYEVTSHAWAPGANQIISYNSKKIFHCSSPPEILPECDIVIVSNQSIADLSRFREHPVQWIIDSSNSRYYAQRLVDQAASLSINLYSVVHSGAYQTTW